MVIDTLYFRDDVTYTFPFISAYHILLFNIRSGVTYFASREKFQLHAQYKIDIILFRVLFISYHYFITFRNFVGCTRLFH